MNSLVKYIAFPDYRNNVVKIETHTNIDLLLKMCMTNVRSEF